MTTNKRCKAYWKDCQSVFRASRGNLLFFSIKQGEQISFLAATCRSLNLRKSIDLFHWGKKTKQNTNFLHFSNKGEKSLEWSISSSASPSAECWSHFRGCCCESHSAKCQMLKKTKCVSPSETQHLTNGVETEPQQPVSPAQPLHVVGGLMWKEQWAYAD